MATIVSPPRGLVMESFVDTRGAPEGRRKVAHDYATTVAPGGRPVLLYLVSEDWYFLSHRLPMACAARDAGYEVHVAANVAHGRAEIESHGFRLHALTWRRGSVHPWHVLRLIRDIRVLYRRVDPDLVHHVALVPAVIGSLAARGLPVRIVNALTGLGAIFTARTPRARLARAVLRPGLRRVLAGPNAVVLVQNPDDAATVQAMGAASSRIHLVRGSGVDLARWVPLPEPDGPMAMAFVGRLLDDKGVRTLVAAHALLEAGGRPLRLLIAGAPDPANPSSIPPDEIDSWRRRPNLELLGTVSDISGLWARAHIAVLPSRREGLPKSLIEAAACGRPIVASDVPGCREIACAGVNASLVPADDPAALADALDRLARDGALRARYAAAGRSLVEREFGAERIGAQTVALYDMLLERARGDT